MSILRNKLPQNLTWWSVNGKNGFGGDNVAAPLLIKGRWEDRQEVYIGLVDRREHISKAVVFVDRDMAVGDYLAEGDQTGQSDPTVVTGAHKIQDYRKVANLRNLDYVRKVIL